MDKIVNVVITDLDNTLWDWTEMWYNSFKSLFGKLISEFQLDEDELYNSFKKLHQKHKSSEFSFLLNELEILTDEQRIKISSYNDNGHNFFYNYYYNKKKYLKLYSNVYDTLVELKKQGVLIVGFTESNSYYSQERIKRLNLDGVIDYLYAPVDKGLPENYQRFNTESSYNLQTTIIRHLPLSTKKPAPEILNIIVKDLNINKNNCIYIGDKIEKDIKMANLTRITSVYAKYGDNIKSEQYELLKKVTHWTNEDVELERLSHKENNENTIANYTINRFDEILNLFYFQSFKSLKKIDPLIVDIWKKVIDVQQHFNDIELKIRQYCLTSFTLILTGIGYIEIAKFNATSNKLPFLIKLFNIDIPIELMLIIVGILIINIFKNMEVNWYHVFLKSAVKQGEDIENRWSDSYPELFLTNSISQGSQKHVEYTNFSFKIIDRIISETNDILIKFGIKKKHSNSDKNVKKFYNRLYFIYSLIFLILFINNNYKLIVCWVNNLKN